MMRIILLMAAFCAASILAQAQDSGWTGEVSIYPQEGPAGGRVLILATGFPPFSRVNVGAGPVESEYEIQHHRLRTNPNGALLASASVPGRVEPGHRWVFIVKTEDHRIKGRSEPFLVTGANMDVVTVQGRLTDEGVECQALRTDDGRLYTLTGDLKEFKAGDRVVVEGRLAELSFCMQGTTLAVNEIRALGR